MNPNNTLQDGLSSQPGSSDKFLQGMSVQKNSNDILSQGKSVNMRSINTIYLGMSIPMNSNNTFQQVTENHHSQIEIDPCSYTSLEAHWNSKKYIHSVQNIAHISLLQALETLVIRGTEIQEPIENIIQNAIARILTNNFNAAELALIIDGNLSTWDAMLLYKVIQRVCGLSSRSSGLWTDQDNDNATLESLLFQMKELHVQVRHHYEEQILSDAELEVLLGELRGLSMKIFDEVVRVADNTGRMVDMAEIENAKLLVDAVIDEVTHQ